MVPLPPFLPPLRGSSFPTLFGTFRAQVSLSPGGDLGVPPLCRVLFLQKVCCWDLVYLPLFPFRGLDRRKASAAQEWSILPTLPCSLSLLYPDFQNSKQKNKSSPSPFFLENVVFRRQIIPSFFPPSPRAAIRVAPFSWGRWGSFFFPLPSLSCAGPSMIARKQRGTAFFSPLFFLSPPQKGGAKF